MNDSFLVLGGDRVTSATHVILGTTDEELEQGRILADFLRTRFGRSPMACPTGVWLRSVALHSRQTGTCPGSDPSRPRTPIWLVSRPENGRDMAAALQLSEAQLRVPESGFLTLAHRYTLTSVMDGIGEVQLSDVCLVLCGDIDKAIRHLVGTVLDELDNSIPEGYGKSTL